MIKGETDTPVYIEIPTSVPDRYTLSQNYPNPFNAGTTILYSMPNSDFVTLKVINVLGREVLSLVNEFKQGGSYSVNFDASNLASVIYFYKLYIGNSFVETKRMILLK